MEEQLIEKKRLADFLNALWMDMDVIQRVRKLNLFSYNYTSANNEEISRNSETTPSENPQTNSNLMREGAPSVDTDANQTT